MGWARSLGESYRRLLGALDHDEFAGRDIAGYPRGPDHR